MRGLAFPADVHVDSEASNGGRSPSNVTDDIPIDPAFLDLPLDPGPSETTKAEQQDEEPIPPQHNQESERTPRKHVYHTYSQAPQGDPAAFQQDLYLPVPPPQEPPPMPRKRKGPKRRKRCSFCRGNDDKNRDGIPEVMVSCSECGRSGHPSCLKLSDVANILHSYAWTCIECKKCEFCHEKGDDEKILFCDRCDRGYHTYCFDPPIADMPTGKWYCPDCEHHYPHECPRQEEIPPQSIQLSVNELFSSPAQSHAELPVASTSKLPHIHVPGRPSHKRKLHTVVSSDDESDGGNVTISVSRPKRRSQPSAKMAASVAAAAEEQKARQMAELEEEHTRSRKRRRVAASSPAPASPHPLRIRLPPQKNKGKERARNQEDGEEDEDESKGLFDDILAPEQRDTSKTSILAEDTRRFETARLRAEERLANSATAQPPEWDTGQAEAEPSSGLRLRSTLAHPRIQQAQTASPAPSTPADPPAAGQRIQIIRFGQFDIKTWYDAPFPEEYSNIPDGRLWICEFCLKYMKSRFSAGRHRMKCKVRHPPGDEIYRDGPVSIFEVDGRRNKIYCQNLCLLSKMFLDHKSLFYDVEPFLFYVMTQMDESGAHFVGYFSKEKRSHKDYNLSCIMTLPVRQRQGWGNLLIDFSYLLSKREQRLGSPEKPLSGLGALGYRNYWKLAVHRYLAFAPEQLRLEDISAATSMTIEDVYSTLKSLDFITVRPSTPPSVRPSPGQAIRFPKGRKHGASRKSLQRTMTHRSHSPPPAQREDEPFVAPKHYDIHWDAQQVEEYLTKWDAKCYLTLKPEKLKWSPFIVMRTRKTEAAEAQETADLATTNMLEGRGFTTPGPVEGDGNVPRVDDALLHIFDDPVQEVESRGQSCRDSSNIQRDTPGPHVQMERDGSPSDSVPPGNKRKAHTQASSRHRRVHDGQREEDCAPTFEAQTQDDFESDAQLAARLAAEERRTSARSLRSRSEVDERSHNLPTPSPVKRTSSRKNGDDRRKQRHRSPSKEATETPTRHAPDVSNRTRNVKGRFLSERAQSRRAHKRKRREPSPEPDSDVAAVDSDDEAADVAGALMATSAAPSPREPTSPPAAQANGDSSGAPTVTADSCSASAHTPPPVLAPLTPSPEQASRSPLSGAEPDTWDDAADPAPLRKPGGKMSLPPEHVNGTHESGKRRAVSAAAAGLTALSANGSAGTHTRGSRENEEDAEGESDDDL